MESRIPLQITVEKVHYDPYPIRDIITAWECQANGVDFLESLKKHILELRKVFDTKQDWAYDVAHANIYINGTKTEGDHWDCMPNWREIDTFLENLDREIDSAVEEEAYWDMREADYCLAGDYCMG